MFTPFSFNRCDKQRQAFLTLSSSFCSMCVLKTSNMLDPPPYGEIAHLGVRGGAQSFDKRKVCVEKLSCLLRKTEERYDQFCRKHREGALDFYPRFSTRYGSFFNSIPSVSSSEMVSRFIPSYENECLNDLEHCEGSGISELISS